MEQLHQESDAQPLYKDASIAIEKRVEDLLTRMTTKEKVYQLSSVVEKAEQHILQDNGELYSNEVSQWCKAGIGQITRPVRKLSPRQAAEKANQLSAEAKEKNRLGIPPILHEEALHGLEGAGATSFPQAIGLAATWDTGLIYRISQAIGKESISRGIRQVLSPTMDIARDARSGRVEETYGEDPVLTAKMVVPFVKGIQEHGVIATPKHFVANFVGDGGRDSYAIHFSERMLREIYFPPFKAAVQEGGALSVMMAYNALDGIPCTINKWLLNGVLRNEWGFNGFVVSDYGAVPDLLQKHRCARTSAEAGKQAVEAGMDVELPQMSCYQEMLEWAETDRVSKQALDDCVRRVLWTKFHCGVYDEPRAADPETAENCSDCNDHRQLALEAARSSIVLLKNQKDILPLGKDINRIAVIGPHAYEGRLGGYSGTDVHVVSPFEGIQQKASDTDVEVSFAEGCENVLDESRKGFEEAVEAAQNADVSILFVGNVSTKDRNASENTGTEGEGADRCNLDLPGAQEELILEIARTGSPIVVVLIGGSAVTMGRWLDQVDAILQAWYPGEEGGNALADIIFGDHSPAGKLPITFPKQTAQLPLYYNHRPTGRRDDYMDLRDEEQFQFPFGYGLSYTRLEYGDIYLSSEHIPCYGQVEVSLDISNVGEREGDEIVQLYLSKAYSRITRPVKELKAFERIHLKAGETKTVTFQVGENELSFLDEHLNWSVEPGTYTVTVGPNSRDGNTADFTVSREDDVSDSN